jgi:hypothetical protein
MFSALIKASRLSSSSSPGMWEMKASRPSRMVKSPFPLSHDIHRIGAGLLGPVISWNRSMEEMTGVKAKDILGKGDYEYAIPF